MTKQEDSEPLIWLTIVVLIVWLLCYPIIDARAEVINTYETPGTIRVRITGRKECGDSSFSHVEIIDFKEYVKGVLPAEWGNDWHEESLKAGAIAVKMYAWAAIEEDGKWGAMPWAQDRVADVYDCDWDQVYKPEWRTEETDKAVDDTWDYFLVDADSGELVTTYYNAYYNGCVIREAEGYCMGQWETRDLAFQGTDWRNILLYFYEDTAVISTVFTYRQSEINPELNEASMVDNMYQIKPGDNLISIAMEFYGTKDYSIILDANKGTIKSARHILTGSWIYIPTSK